MTKKHYAYLSPSYVADTIRANFPTLGIGGDSAVVPMRGGMRTLRATRLD